MGTFLAGYKAGGHRASEGVRDWEQEIAVFAGIARKRRGLYASAGEWAKVDALKLPQQIPELLV